jgi:bifunctional DNA-binding transcriptional regulator/antitoxin component of YhaV-PrlF toxin-antitoxin module
VRRAGGIEPGTELYFSVVGPGHVEVIVLPRPRPVGEAARCHTLTGEAPNLQTLRDDRARELVEQAQEAADSVQEGAVVQS